MLRARFSPCITKARGSDGGFAVMGTNGMMELTELASLDGRQLSNLLQQKHTCANRALLKLSVVIQASVLFELLCGF